MVETPTQEAENPNLAPLISTLIPKNLTFRSLEEQPESPHYLLKCTDGIFSGKFLFINTTPDGEVFGSGDPEVNQDITMYIESAQLSERHADIKFVPSFSPTAPSFMSWASSASDVTGADAANDALYERQGSYVLKDLHSELGTWVRIPGSYARQQHSKLLNLHRCIDAVTFRVAEHHFIFETDQSMETIDEVCVWINLYRERFPALEQLLEQNDLRFKRMRQLAEVLDASVFQQLEGDEVVSQDMIAEIMRDIDYIASLDLVQTGPKLKLNLRFTDGPAKGKIISCDYSKSMIVFGSLENPTEEQLIKLVGTADCQYVMLEGGDRVIENHFQVLYDPILCSLLIQSACVDCFESCGVYRRLEQNEEFALEPDDAFRIGTLEFQVQRFNTGVMSDIGQRECMEDSYQCVQDLNLHPKVPVSYFAVFDGHGGYQCAQFLRDNLHFCLTDAFLNRNKQYVSQAGTPASATPLNCSNSAGYLLECENLAEGLSESITDAFATADRLFQEKFGELAKQCGSTAVVCLLIGNKLVCANLGDARAVMSREGRCVELSQDFKASRKDEQERIKGQGGYIVFGRVLGRLAVTRAFGDFECKQIMVENKDTQKKELRNFVLCEPEIRVTTIDRARDEFIILASDGLFDRFSSEECVNLARQKFLQQDSMEQDPYEVARHLVTESVSVRVNSDNTTAFIVALNSGVEDLAISPELGPQKFSSAVQQPLHEAPKVAAVDPFANFAESGF